MSQKQSLLYLILAGLIIASLAQQSGTLKQNVLLPFPTVINDQPLQTKLTIDANWRWYHYKDNYENCYANGWNTKYCADVTQCNKNCLLEGVPPEDWVAPYGVKVEGSAVTLNYVTQGPYGTNVGSRLYVLDASGTQYQFFQLLNKEFILTVDMSKVPCGLNGAVYFVEMTPNPLAPFGVGYGDAQCPTDIKFIDGVPNLNKAGACSAEMDIWEANRHATAFTPHTCSVKGVSKCVDGKSCGTGQYRHQGVCDKDGADFNPFRLGDESLYGFGNTFKVDTSKPVTVITQFITHNGKDTGDLLKIKRYYKQGDKVIFGGELTDASIMKQKQLFQEPNHFAQLGGLKGMGESMKRGMVLVLSLWDDESSQMLWLDSTFPVGSEKPGTKRGPCAATNRDTATLRKNFGPAQVKYSEVKLQAIKNYDMQPTPVSPPPPSVPSPATSCEKVWVCKSCSFV